MDHSELRLRFAAELWLFLPQRKRGPEASAPCDTTSTLGHVIQSSGVPLTEVGRLLVNGHPVAPSHRPGPGDVVHILGIERPQKPPFHPPRFVLDVHLGALARRLRLVGVDTAYRNDLDDDTLIERANAEQRVLLTQDRRLLHRRILEAGAFVRGHDPDHQVLDVLERFAPPLAPWSRCTACNGLLAPVDKRDVAHLLEAGTRATYDTFARCRSCGRIYWPGAHHRHLTAIVDAAERTVSAVAGPQRRS
ncbi:Mut7-C RNAse domain-containing protein [Allosalinactinospora lopnorensis]|uniref:Mut7-C RNAse domain-containing protein n=1 Tax=Allosalinactinospora lopnorensis TaxID=1352348 RepID=UPI000623D43E|nr:Mut7-C RNAse domain-containing protein [Allosalinactinospora lopnorensis]